MPDNNPLTPPKSSNGCFIMSACVVGAALITCAVMLLLFWRTSLSISDQARQMAQTIATEFDRTLNITPEVLINSVVVVAASAPVTELVFLEKQAVIRHQWKQTWLHSTKNFEIEATFTAKAGFDLAQPFRVQIDPVTHNMSTDFPPPKILSIGMSDVRVLRDEDGLWNKLTEEDRSEAFAAIEKQAREQFQKSSLLVETRDVAEKRIREILDTSGRQIELDSKRNTEVPPPALN